MKKNYRSNNYKWVIIQNQTITLEIKLVLDMSNYTT